MNTTKILQGPCSHCGHTIRYPAHMVGTTGKCPACGQISDLILEEPDVSEGGISKRTLLWTLLTIFVLALGLAGAMIALKNAQDLQKQKQGTPAPKVQPSI